MEVGRNTTLEILCFSDIDDSMLYVIELVGARLLRHIEYNVPQISQSLQVVFFIHFV